MAELENGYTRLANEILENMARIKLSPTQYRLIFVIWRYTYGYGRKERDLSLNFLVKATGCDKRQIQRELKTLEEKKIIYQKIKTGAYRIIGFNKNHEEWEGKVAGTIGETINTTVGETVNGESEESGESIGETINITIGESVNTSDGVGKTAIGETINTRVGEIVNTTIGETVNQERKNKENFKEINDDDEESARDEMTPQELFQAIETKYIQRRARGTQTTPQDDADIRQVIEYGIPLDDVLRLIDERFDTYEPKHPRDRINSFGYVADYIFQRYHEEQRKKNVKRSEFTVIEGGAQYGSTTRKGMGSGMEESKRAKEYSGYSSGATDTSIAQGRIGWLRKPTTV
jgi:phage replication O-like protein O